jgi:hypothetical protein
MVRHFPQTNQSIHLGPAEDAPNKCISREKADRAREQAVDQAGQKAVAEEQHARHEALNVQSRRVVPHTVDEDPKCTGAADKEALPPPMVVLEESSVVRTRPRPRPRQSGKWSLPQSKVECMSR